MSQTVRWGVLGTGNIARQFASGLGNCRRGKTIATGSRTQAAADAFARAYGFERAYGSYEQVLSDQEVDAVYVSLPNSMHHEWTIRALRAGKHVLCEKPFAVNAAQSQEMFDVARKEGRVVVEAFMYRAHPLTAEVIRSVREGAIGEVKLIRTSFCYCTSRRKGNIRFDAELAGGGLMDVGCYCIGFSRLFGGGDPVEIRAAGHLLNGVDEVAAATLVYPNGVIATMSCGMTVHANNTAYLCGSEGYIEIPVPWKPPREQAEFTITRSTPPRMDSAASKAGAAPSRETRLVDAGMDLYGLEADAFAGAVRDGAEPFVTEDETLGNMRVLDKMRSQLRE